MEVKIKQGSEMLDATIEMVDGVMVVSPRGVTFEPKDGDVCCSESCVYIYKSLRDDKAIIYYCVMYKSSGHITIKEDVGVGFIHSDWHHFATEEEKKRLFDKLAEKGLEWKADTKEFVKLKWKPKVGEIYYTIAGNTCSNNIFFVESYKWVDDSRDNKLYSKRIVFKTKEECQEFCKRLNQAIEGIKP